MSKNLARPPPHDIEIGHPCTGDVNTMDELTKQDKSAIVFHGRGIQQTVPSLFGEFIKNANVFYNFKLIFTMAKFMSI